MAKTKPKKLNIKRYIAIILILAGIGVMVYPFINNEVYKIKQNEIIDDYNKRIEDAKKPKKKHNKHTQQDNKPEIDFNGLRKAVKAYNKSLVTEGQDALNASTCTEQAVNLYKYGLTDNIYGYISIPKLGVNMALYLGASEYNMANGATQLNKTSIPYGGKNENAVVAGHCGYWGQQMFQYIHTLTKGDIVYITTPFETLTYKVTSQKVIDPTDFRSMLIQKDKTLLTLFTCYPYPTNRQRICIYCEKI